MGGVTPISPYKFDIFYYMKVQRISNTYFSNIHMCVYSGIALFSRRVTNANAAPVSWVLTAKNRTPVTRILAKITEFAWIYHKATKDPLSSVCALTVSCFLMFRNQRRHVRFTEVLANIILFIITNNIFELDENEICSPTLNKN